MFLVKRAELVLRLRIKDYRLRPLPHIPCELDLEGATRKLATDGEGLVERSISPMTDASRLSVGNFIAVARVGHLDPIDEITGIQARLNNLGYEAGSTPDPTDRAFRSAVEGFQCDAGLSVDGEISTETRARMLAAHGC